MWLFFQAFLDHIWHTWNHYQNADQSFIIYSFTIIQYCLIDQQLVVSYFDSLKRKWPLLRVLDRRVSSCLSSLRSDHLFQGRVECVSASRVSVAQDRTLATPSGTRSGAHLRPCPRWRQKKKKASTTSTDLYSHLPACAPGALPRVRTGCCCRRERGLIWE